jgi:hypothetical protein
MTGINNFIHPEYKQRLSADKQNYWLNIIGMDAIDTLFPIHEVAYTNDHVECLYVNVDTTSVNFNKVYWMYRSYQMHDDKQMMRCVYGKIDEDNTHVIKFGG